MMSSRRRRANESVIFDPEMRRQASLFKIQSHRNFITDRAPKGRNKTPKKNSWCSIDFETGEVTYNTKERSSVGKESSDLDSLLPDQETRVDDLSDISGCKDPSDSLPPSREPGSPKKRFATSSYMSSSGRSWSLPVFASNLDYNSSAAKSGIALTCSEDSSSTVSLQRAYSPSSSTLLTFDGSDEDDDLHNHCNSSPELRTTNSSSVNTDCNIPLKQNLAPKIRISPTYIAPSKNSEHQIFSTPDHSKPYIFERKTFSQYQYRKFSEKKSQAQTSVAPIQPNHFRSRKIIGVLNTEEDFSPLKQKLCSNFNPILLKSAVATDCKKSPNLCTPKLPAAQNRAILPTCNRSKHVPRNIDVLRKTVLKKSFQLSIDIPSADRSVPVNISNDKKAANDIRNSCEEDRKKERDGSCSPISKQMSAVVVQLKQRACTENIKPLNLKPTCRAFGKG